MYGACNKGVIKRKKKFTPKFHISKLTMSRTPFRGHSSERGTTVGLLFGTNHLGEGAYIDHKSMTERQK